MSRGWISRPEAKGVISAIENLPVTSWKDYLNLLLVRVLKEHTMSTKEGEYECYEKILVGRGKI